MFPDGTLTIIHAPVRTHDHFNDKKCSGTFRESGRYVISAGTDQYEGVTGSGNYRVVGTLKVGATDLTPAHSPSRLGVRSTFRTRRRLSRVGCRAHVRPAPVPVQSPVSLRSRCHPEDRDVVVHHGAARERGRGVEPEVHLVERAVTTVDPRGRDEHAVLPHGRGTTVRVEVQPRRDADPPVVREGNVRALQFPLSHALRRAHGRGTANLPIPRSR